MSTTPVVTIDGPSGTGKGTITAMLAEHLNWHMLDSGVLYRALALVLIKKNISLVDEAVLCEQAKNLNIRFEPHKIILDDLDVSTRIREPEVSTNASKVAALPKVREALVARQRAFRQAPGLVTDGRDMGTVIFPDAFAKFYLDASADERAARRYEQLKSKGLSVKLASLLADIKERDDRDKNRSISPLKPAKDAVVVDTSKLSIQEVFDIVRFEVKKLMELTEK